VKTFDSRIVESGGTREAMRFSYLVQNGLHAAREVLSAAIRPQCASEPGPHGES
jgi:hypothetical protein